MQPPPTKYAERDGVSIAYQVVGEGPDVLFAPGFISHLDLQWTDPGYARFLGRLASFARLILFDKPGTGLSDPVPQVPTIEERAADMVAVLDAAGSREASVIGFSEGGPTAAMLAATHPHRVRSLAMYGTFAVHLDRLSEEEVAAIPEPARSIVTKSVGALDDAVANWGEGAGLRVLAPSVTSDVRRRFFATFERASASPRMARALIDGIRQIDVRDVLPAISCPTLVLHHSGDLAVPPVIGRAVADLIPGASFVEIPGDDHAFWFGDLDPVVDELERFLTGNVRATEPQRALATVLFTDVAGSTERAAELGDRAWRELLERHDALARGHVEAQGGRVVKHMGDGLLATFDGPARAIRAAEDLLAAVEPLAVQLRAGIHTGEVELIGDDVGGMAVHIGARVGALADPGEILVSSTVRDLVVGSQLRFAERGEHELKGVPGSWRVYAVGEQRAPAPEPLDAAGDHMRRSDRIAVSLARRAPRMMRLGARAVARS